MSGKHQPPAHLPAAFRLLSIKSFDGGGNRIIHVGIRAAIGFGHARDLPTHIPESARISIGVGVLCTDYHIPHVRCGGKPARGACTYHARTVGGVAQCLGHGGCGVHQPNLGTHQQQRHLTLVNGQGARVKDRRALINRFLRLSGGVKKRRDFFVHSHLNNDGVGEVQHQIIKVFEVSKHGSVNLVRIHLRRGKKRIAHAITCSHSLRAARKPRAAS